MNYKHKQIGSTCVGTAIANGIEKCTGIVITEQELVKYYDSWDVRKLKTVSFRLSTERFLKNWEQRPIVEKLKLRGVKIYEPTLPNYSNEVLALAKMRHAVKDPVTFVIGDIKLKEDSPRIPLNKKFHYKDNGKPDDKVGSHELLIYSYSEKTKIFTIEDSDGGKYSNHGEWTISEKDLMKRFNHIYIIRIIRG